MGKQRHTKYVQDSNRLPVTKLMLSSRCAPTPPCVCDMRGKGFLISSMFLLSGQIGNTESELKKLAEENPDLQEAYIAKQKRLKVSGYAGSTAQQCTLWERSVLFLDYLFTIVDHWCMWYLWPVLCFRKTSESVVAAHESWGSMSSKSAWVTKWDTYKQKQTSKKRKEEFFYYIFDIQTWW